MPRDMGNIMPFLSRDIFSIVIYALGLNVKCYVESFLLFIKNFCAV
jgi:hypothetical protein